MATNHRYAGENLVFQGELTDRDGSAILFTDVTTMTIEVCDERGVEFTYTKAAGGITVGSTTSSYLVEVDEADSALFSPGKLYFKMTFSFASSDAPSGSVTDIYEDSDTVLKKLKCQ